VTSGSLYRYDKKAAHELKAMAAQAAKIRSKKPAEGFVRALTEIAGAVPDSHLFFRGDHEQPKDTVLPGGLTVVSSTTELGEIPVKDAQRQTSGRRLALASRLTNPDYPLTAPVIANRVWLHHFGRGLVATPTDFGTLGTPPTHPDLLDWLACELMDSS
jgi:hypothetical protein